MKFLTPGPWNQFEAVGSIDILVEIDPATGQTKWHMPNGVVHTVDPGDKLSIQHDLNQMEVVIQTTVDNQPDTLCATCCKPYNPSGPVCRCLVFHPGHVECCSVCSRYSHRSKEPNG